jgi:hypothetical protein
MEFTFLRVAFFFSLVLLLGCSKANPNIPIKGKVIVAGKPASGALLIFLKGTGVDSVSGSAMAAEDGTFSVESSMKNGLPPGSYSVAITWPDTSIKLTPGQIMQGARPEDGPDLLKGKYSDHKTSNLRVEVNAGMTEIPTFEL